MSCPEDVYRRIPSGAAIQQRPAGEPAQQSADGPSPHYFPAAERRRRGPPADPRAAPPPPPASQPGPGREAPAAGYRPPPRARPSQPPPPQPQPLLFPKTNPMVTPGEAKRYQASSYELPERAAPKRDPREDRPRTCPPERTVSGREQLRAVPPAGRPAPPDRIGPPDRLGPPERHGAPAAERSAAEVAASAAGAGVDPRPPGYPTQLGPRLSDDRLLSGSPRELLARYRHAEAEIARLMMEHGQQLRELNRQLQAQAAEQRAVQEVHRRLQDESQELRDLCCFLDDDRQKGRKLAREWQRFGRYTASVMRQEVSAYQTKLRQLDAKQQELVKDNLELKELCLYLDEERQGPGSLCSNCGAALNQPRDDGDGSSSSTAADEPAAHSPPPPAADTERPRRSESRERLLEESIQRQRNLLNEHILQYIRGLERRLDGAEEAGGGRVSRPDAVVQAMRLLEVQEHLEWESAALGRPAPPEAGQAAPPLEGAEAALLRQMCNVVWRKLEDAPNS